MLRNLKLRPKLLVIGIILTIAPLIVAGIFVYWQNTKSVAIAGEESIKLATTDLDHVAEGVYKMAETQNELLKQSLRSYLNVARNALIRAGGASLTDQKVSWTAVNQYTKKEMSVSLPKMMVGNTWLGKVTDTNVSVPVVDYAREINPQLTCTIFERMNRSGDILRVATNVPKKDGTRAIGTYIPAVNPDGKPNPVVSKVMKGETFVGRAFVVNAWYITAYEPIYDSQMNIIGVLYVGILQESIKELRQAVYDIKVGKTGYVYVLDSQGHYTISNKGVRDGELIINAKDSDGKLFIQSIIKTATALKPGQVGVERYPWKNPGDPKARMKTARLMYFAPWDWVIGAGSYDEEFLGAAQKIEEMGKQSNLALVLVIVVSILVSGGVWLLVSGGIARPIIEIAEAVNTVARTRDLTIEVPVAGQDEVGVMGSEFNNMVKLLRESFMQVASAAKDTAGFAIDVAQRATANKERAEVQEQQMQTVQETVKEMGGAAGQVADASNQQKEAAVESNQTIEQLAVEIAQIANTSREQVDEAGTATERVAAMGETGALVAATAQKQGEQVIAVTSAVDEMAGAVEELTAAANRAMEFANSALQGVEEGSEAVRATVDGMQSISESSEQIAEIITVITEIAEQTNLLSLNAAIEAARAGAHGKGFAVVADEVGKLAQRSSEAAKEITKLIKDSSARVAEGSKLTDQSRVALDKIAKGGDTNIQAVEEIARIAGNLAEGTRQVNEMMGNLNQLAEEIGGMAGQQGERRKAAQDALSMLVDKSSSIADLVGKADDRAKEIGESMQGVVDRTDAMQEMTVVQAGHAERLNEITNESATAAKDTVEGAGTVVGITDELQRLSQELNRQVNQFKVGDGTGAGDEKSVV